MTGAPQNPDPAAFLRGATASVFVALVMDPQPQTISSLMAVTGYSYRPVRAALAELEGRDVSRYLPHGRCWMLNPGAALVVQLLQVLLAVYGRRPNSAVLPAGLSTELSTAPPPVGETPTVSDISASAPESRPATDGADSGEKASDAAKNAGGKEWDAAGQCGEAGRKAGAEALSSGEMSQQSGEKSQQSGEKSGDFALSPPGDARTITTTTERNRSDPLPDQSSSRYNPQTARGRPPLTAAQKPVFEWLRKGGIGPGSPKMQQLLALGLDLEVVKAHVLERLAHAQGIVEADFDYSPGLLIHKLISGDPPPPMRCARCLTLPGRLGLCRCELDSLVKR